ncbi:MAG TPA: hypothetical protein VHC69_21065 [Polyangiaceae bacterium]|nr:hypothetical protein [Polyangiaceae bacterium]
MSIPQHFKHSPACDCSHHVHEHKEPAAARTLWTLLGPLVACVFCPVCISHWAPFAAGIVGGVAISEGQHLAVLLGGLGVALVPALIAARKTGRRAAAAVTVFGVVVLLADHLIKERPAIEAFGMLALVAGAVLTRRTGGAQAAQPARHEGSS